MNKKLKMILGGGVLALILVFSVISCEEVPLPVDVSINVSESLYSVRTSDNVPYLNSGVPVMSVGYYKAQSLTSSAYASLLNETTATSMTDSQIRAWLTARGCQSSDLTLIATYLESLTNYAFIARYDSNYCYVIMKY